MTEYKDEKINKLSEPIDNFLKLNFNQPDYLYNHLKSSYDQLHEMISYLLTNELNIFFENNIKEITYFHGFKCTNIRIKPSTFENDNEIKFPCDARKNHLNYFATIVGDVQQYVEKIDAITNEKTINYINEVEKETHIANIPIMVKSKYCSTTIKQDLRGECKYDPGGYFIVSGQEKVVMSIEKMVDNKIVVYNKKDSSYENGYLYSVHINSKKNDWSDNLQILTIKNRKDGVLIVNASSNLVDVPLFILMRALGIETDKEIISYITYDLEDVKMFNLIRPSISYSVDDNDVIIKTKEEAIEYLITKIKKNKRITQSNEEIAKIQKIKHLDKILKLDLLPHLGEDIPKKIAYLGLMTNTLLKVMLNRRDPDDRDALQNKRIETPGVLIGQLFRQNWKKMLNEIRKHFSKKNISDEAPINVINQIKPSIIEHGLKTALATGQWGMNKTKKGVAQSLQRISWIQAVSALRRVITPSMEESTSKVTSIRHVNSNQCQFLCPTETPEGPKVGIVKSLSMIATITTQNLSQMDVIKNILKQYKNIKHPYDIDPLTMNSYVKIFINGDWYGICKLDLGYDIYNNLKMKRREHIIDMFTSIVFDFSNKELKIYSDGGRLIRPLLIVNNNNLNITDEVIQDINHEMNQVDKSKSWKKIINKYPNLIEYEDIESLNYLMVAENYLKLFDSIESKNKKVEYNNNDQINRYGDYRWIKYTHCEFNAWCMLGNTVANIPFSNHNYGNRNILHFAQAKQSIGIYLTSYKDRIDISHILYHPHIPLVTTQAMQYNGTLDLPCGENAIIAICSYTGYNQEDSIIFNQSAIDRGLFRTDTLRKYHSEIKKNPSTSQDDVFTKPDRNKVTGMKQGNYEKLNEKGYVPEETIINNEDVIIGKISPIQPTGNNNKVYKDSSEIFKSNIPGVIDRVHTGIYNNEGYEMYNVRVRMERIPVIGDKFTTFHGSKGTIGITYKQKDMPFTESGIIPDLILNPHGFPSRMSLGHFIECLAAKTVAETGKFIDGTPFNDYDVNQLPVLLKDLGYSPYGTEKMYCGLTGRKMDVEIFIGPVYTLKLKHMVLDKVHGRARGPKQALTRQPLEGRSKDGGLKIGEMEKDALVAHGMGQFLKERFMETSDITKAYVCDECGMFAAKVIDKDYYKCKGCQNSTRISSIVIPYAFKLLTQELTSVNILPRIRTERNIYVDEA
jgi:DNA-directed RNA polymerase II subunit RPB2